MFQKGDYVVCGNNGICVVENVTTLNMTNIPKDSLYYILKPVYSESSKVYIPVNNHKAVMRPALTAEDVHALIARIPSMELIWVENEKQREHTYKECMRNNNCEDFVRIIKTLYLRKKDRQLKGQKVIGLDDRYLKMAEDLLYGELAVALKIEKKNVQAYITEKIGKQTEK